MEPVLLDWLWKAGLGFLIALAWYIIKDRRKQKIEEELAEGTKIPNIKKAGIEALESQILAMSKAWDEERESKDRRIVELKEDAVICLEKIAAQGAVIKNMKDQTDRMEREIENFKRQLSHFTEITADPNGDEL